MKKGISILLALGLSIGLLSACGSTNNTSAETSQVIESSADVTESAEASEKETTVAEEIASDEIVTLKWYMSINPVAPDTKLVIEELNKYTRDKIGVEIDYQVMANPDYREKMPNIVNSGEYFDIAFTANWTLQYLQFVSRDAFLDITELLPEYAKETYEFLPEDPWTAVSVDGKIYGVPSYKEMGWQGGIVYNSDMAEEYGIDMSDVKTVQDYTAVLATVAEKSKAANKSVIGISGLTNSFSLSNPYESLTGSPNLPGASTVPGLSNFSDLSSNEVFNQFESNDFLEYCKLTNEWNSAGYLGGDPVNYDTDTANRDNDFNNGSLFSYFIQYAPGAAQAMSVTAGHGVEFLPLMKPVFETRSSMGGLLAISSASEHPEKALELINLLNTDLYVGTLIRHGIEGTHHSAVGDKQVDKTMGGTLSDNGYDYTFGWQFGTPFNQKWDISYPDDIAEQFQAYNEEAIPAKHVGFTFDTAPADTQIAAITNVVAEYLPALETGMVNPEEYVPQFIEALKANGVDDLIAEINDQLAK